MSAYMYIYVQFLIWKRVALISLASKIMLKILQARLQQYMNHELPVVQAGFRNPASGFRIAEEPEIKLSKFIGSYRKQGNSREKSTSASLTSLAFDCEDHNKLWKILKETGIPDHLNCLLRNLYAGQEATVRTGHGTMDWFKIGKGVRQGCILSLCLFKFYAEWWRWWFNL